MTPRFAPSRLVLAAVAVLLLVGVAGCGGGGGYSSFEGTLEIENVFGSSDDIVGIDIDEVGGPDFYSFDVFMTPDSPSFFIDLYPTTYDVTIYWGFGAVDGYIVDIFDNELTYLPVAN